MKICQFVIKQTHLGWAGAHSTLAMPWGQPSLNIRADRDLQTPPEVTRVTWDIHILPIQSSTKTWLVRKLKFWRLRIKELQISNFSWKVAGSGSTMLHLCTITLICSWVTVTFFRRGMWEGIKHCLVSLLCFSLLPWWQLEFGMPALFWPTHVVEEEIYPG